MPSSRFDLIPLVLNIVIQQKPKSILDVGVGFGKYGVLFREYLDIWNTKEKYGKRNLKLYGIEAFGKYKNPVWDVYDKVFIGDISKLFPRISKLGRIDLLFLGDVIEHFTKPQAKKILSKLNYDRVIIITPEIPSVQSAVYGNPYEKHKSKWTIEDFPNMKHFKIYNQQIFWS